MCMFVIVLSIHLLSGVGSWSNVKKTHLADGMRISFGFLYSVLLIPVLVSMLVTAVLVTVVL